MILGNSLLVMNSLAEKEGLRGQVQMIYLDPLYGIKFGSNWQPSTKDRKVEDRSLVGVTREPEQIKAFCDAWKDGLHSYLAFWRDRLIVARELLTETGAMFLQIGQDNSQLMRLVFDEILGDKNFLAEILFRKKSMPLGSNNLESMHDRFLWYAKDSAQSKVRRLEGDQPLRGRGDAGVQGWLTRGGCVAALAATVAPDLVYTSHRAEGRDHLATHAAPLRFTSRNHVRRESDSDMAGSPIVVLFFRHHEGTLPIADDHVQASAGCRGASRVYLRRRFLRCQPCNFADHLWGLIAEHIGAETALFGRLLRYKLTAKVAEADPRRR